MKSLAIIVFLVLVSSCANKETSYLYEDLQKEYSVPEDIQNLSKSNIIQYQEEELGMNQYYINQVKRIIDESFDNRLNDFEDNELGFFASYKYMFQYPFLNKTKRKDHWDLKVERYFNNLDIHQELHSEYIRYSKDITNLRRQLVTDQDIKLNPEVKVELNNQEINFDKFSDYVLTNWIVEFGLDIAAWLFILLIIAILGIFGVAWTGGYSAFATVLSVVISIIISMWNDNRLVDDIREQYKENSHIEYNEMLLELNSQTIEFYEKL